MGKESRQVGRRAGKWGRGCCCRKQSKIAPGASGRVDRRRLTVTSYDHSGPGPKFVDQGYWYSCIRISSLLRRICKSCSQGDQIPLVVFSPLPRQPRNPAQSGHESSRRLQNRSGCANTGFLDPFSDSFSSGRCAIPGPNLARTPVGSYPFRALATALHGGERPREQGPAGSLHTRVPSRPGVQSVMANPAKHSRNEGKPSSSIRTVEF